MCLSERHTEKLGLTLPRGHTVLGGPPDGANFSQEAWTYRSTYQVVQNGDQTRIEVTREYVADCKRKTASREGRTTRDDLRRVIWKDLRAQVTISGKARAR